MCRLIQEECIETVYGSHLIADFWPQTNSVEVKNTIIHDQFFCSPRESVKPMMVSKTCYENKIYKKSLFLTFIFLRGLQVL